MNQYSETLQQRDMLRLLSFVLVAVGLLIAGYLSYTKLTDTTVICLADDSQSCDVVQSSAYSRIAGIDIAYLGFLTYLALGALLVAEDRIKLLHEYGPLLIFGITLFAFAYAVWLFYVQAVILQAFCTWCLGHELTMTLLFVASAIRLWRHLNAD